MIGDEWERRRRKWDDLAESWVSTSPPAIPSAEDLEHFRRCLRRLCRQGDYVLLLGVTLGLRRLFIDDILLSRVRLICVDWSQRMYQRQTEAGGIGNANEEFYAEDWLQFTLQDRRAVAIIGDKAIDNVPYQLWRQFFQRCAENLSPSGRIILHVGLITQQFRNIRFRRSLSKWAGLKQEKGVSTEDAAAGLWEDCLSGSAFLDDHVHVLSLRKFADEIRRALAERAMGRLQNVEADVLDVFWRSFGSSLNDEWTGFTLQDIEAAIAGLFALDRVMYSADYAAAESQPIVEIVRVVEDL